jgi:lipid II:glycine glycyltransferase (peptidoglycan interpeptide bridge formation enzyme)
MIRLQGRAALYGDVWFDEEPPADADVDIVRYHCRPTPLASARSASFLSMTTNLRADTESLSEPFSKDCKYKIRRADTKDNLVMECITDPQPRLAEFCAFFDEFAKQKSHEPSDRQWLQAACKAGQLLLTSASRNGEVLVWHAHLLCGTATWLQYSGSCFRDKQTDYRSLVGRANRWLHWKDMLWFKEMGVSRYDWGGLFQDESTPERAGINAFKKSFGGIIERTYECIVPRTVKGRIYLPLRDAWHNRKSIFSARKASMESA